MPHAGRGASSHKAGRRLTAILFATLIATGCDPPPADPPPAAVSITNQAAVFLSPLSKAEQSNVAADPPVSKSWHVKVDAAETFPTAAFDRVPDTVERLRWDSPADAVLIDRIADHSWAAVNLPDLVAEDAVARLLANDAVRSVRLGVSDGRAFKVPDDPPPLTHLHLIGFTLDAAAVERIGAVRELQSLYIDGGRLDEDAFAAMLETRPDLHVHVDSLHPDGSQD